MSSLFIPILTTLAGRCLTVDNWQDVGVTMAAYDLAALLMKPGFELLRTLPELATYVGWQGDIVLNATMPKLDKDLGYTIRSEYDGRRSRYDLDELLLLIAQLNPRLVLLPEGVHQGWQALPSRIIPFFRPVDLPLQAERVYGVYLLYDAATPFSSLVKTVQEHNGIPCYVRGDLSVPLMQELAALGVQYISSDQPARDASEGRVYCNEGWLSLTDDAVRLDFAVIDEHCNCSTCKQQLSRAYLHHLLEHTPLLCQRFLIQHNVCHSSFTLARNPDIM